jgi:hypothetical protein
MMIYICNILLSNGKDTATIAAIATAAIIGTAYQGLNLLPEV